MNVEDDVAHLDLNEEQVKKSQYYFHYLLKHDQNT